MSTVNFSVPEEVKDAFNAAFEGQNKSAIIADLMREAVERRVDTIVKNSFAFGGVNCVLTLQRHCQA